MKASSHVVKPKKNKYVGVWATFTKPEPLPKPYRQHPDRRVRVKPKTTICRVCGKSFQQPKWRHRTTCLSMPWDAPGTKCLGIAKLRAQGKQAGPITFAKVINMPGMRELAPDEQIRNLPMNREQQFLYGDR